ncbi:GxxExxY protein [Pleurocapsales cyanobacterium LEGE 10410]|nr:GxxExxY protein [Pleurocapsales cyanobacterium LEGE 10410]
MSRSQADLNDLTQKIIGCAFEVSNVLGCGFLEKVYERALVRELSIAGLDVQAQYPISVYYKKTVVGNFFADILVEKSILVELKALNSLENKHQAQCLNYLKASGLNLCLLINFGQPKIQIKRIIQNPQTNTTHR